MPVLLPPLRSEKAAPLGSIASSCSLSTGSTSPRVSAHQANTTVPFLAPYAPRQSKSACGTPAIIESDSTFCGDDDDRLSE